jgi:prepilin peptidase CpaA
VILKSTVWRYAALIAFALLMLAAAYEDFARRIIPNLVIVSLCAVWPLYFLAAQSVLGAVTSAGRSWPASRWQAALSAIGCAFAVLIIGVLCFVGGFVGGGDVKLLTAATLWAGPARTPALLALTLILGGAQALLLLAHPGGPGSVPLGIAIAGAALIVTFLQAVPP